MYDDICLMVRKINYFFFFFLSAVALLNYIRCGILWRIFCQTGTFRGVFSIISLAVYLCTSAQGVFNMPLFNTINSLNIEENNKKRKNIEHTV